MIRRVLAASVLCFSAFESPSARAYNWNIGPAGPTGAYRVETGSFSSAQETEIDLGAAAWNAGSSEILRGANFHWSRAANVATGALGNFRNEVYMRDQAWFDDHNWGDPVARTQPSLGDTDIIFNAGYTWCTGRPSNCGDDFSIGQVAAHEFGHRIGFGHEDDNIALMNWSYPNGGDLGAASYRINEDDYVGLVDHKTDSSTGVNLMLSRYMFVPGTDPNTYDASSHEVWNNGDRVFDVSLDDFAGTPPEPILAITESTSVVSPGIEWRLSSDTACFSGPDYLIGTRTPTLGANVPSSVTPLDWHFSGGTLPSGAYYLCARINPNGAITEVVGGGTDNTVRSESLVQVRQ